MTCGRNEGHHKPYPAGARDKLSPRFGSIRRQPSIVSIGVQRKERCMRPQALFINGIYRSVLEEILSTHSTNPDRTLYLQPYDGRPIVLLRDCRPTVKDPVRLYASTTDELSHVSFSADIVGWEDKTKISQSRTRELNEIIQSFQPGEECLYDYAKSPEKPSLNLIHIRRLIRLPAPFSVANLIKISDGESLSTNRTQAGGWSPVRVV